MQEIIIGRHGTQATPITDMTVSKQHCRLTINDDGSWTLENLSQNGTKVNGTEIVKAKVTPKSRVQLGPQFTATLGDLIGTLSSPSQPQSASGPSAQAAASSAASVKAFDISHLRDVWESYNQANINMLEQQRKVNLVRTGAAVFTMGSAVVATLVTGPLGLVMTGIGLIGNLYSFVGMKNAETAEERQSRQEAFDDAWVCPNCGHSLMAKNYKLLVRNYKACPYCKCRYVEQS